MSSISLHRVVGTVAVGVDALVFYVAVVPVVRAYGLANLPFFLVALALLRREYRTRFIRELRARLARAE